MLLRGYRWISMNTEHKYIRQLIYNLTATFLDFERGCLHVCLPPQSLVIANFSCVF